MADKISVTGEKPSIKSAEDFDVFSGKAGLSREAYKASTFHNSSQENGDASFNHKAELMETTGGMLFEEEEKGETNTEKKEESKLD